MSQEDLPFKEEYNTEPPVPVETVGQVANGCLDENDIPDDLFPEEHSAHIGNWKVLRSTWACQQCGSEIYYHPETIVPHNCVSCFNCSYAPIGITWWEDARLSDII